MYVLYYASMLRCWHLIWILVRTDHPCLGVGCHTPGGPSFTPLLVTPPHQQQAMPPSWSPWTGTCDQQSFTKSFNTMALTPPTVTDWVADSGTSNHTTSDTGNLTYVRPPYFTDHSSIVVGNRSALPVTSVGDSALPSPFYLNNILVTSDII
jgi:hypothetical protein